MASPRLSCGRWGRRGGAGGANGFHVAKPSPGIWRCRPEDRRRPEASRQARQGSEGDCRRIHGRQDGGEGRIGVPSSSWNRASRKPSRRRRLTGPHCSFLRHRRRVACCGCSWRRFWCSAGLVGSCRLLSTLVFIGGPIVALYFGSANTWRVGQLARAAPWRGGACRAVPGCAVSQRSWAGSASVGAFA